jgi:cytochrome c55X
LFCRRFFAQTRSAFVVTLCAKAGLWAALAFAAASASANETGLDTARLTNLVREDCGSCHGLTLKGGLGKPLTPEHLRIWSHDQLVAIILDGVPGTPMPPWRPLLSEAEVQWIAERLQKGDLP